MTARIPFNKPFLVGTELTWIREAVLRGNLAGKGHFTEKCQEILQDQLGLRNVMMTSSCTSALEMAAILCGLAQGDEVIMPSFTYPSTANAVVRAGARPVFVDLRCDTLNIDEGLVEAAITERTKALFVVHYSGVACAMDRLKDISSRRELYLVEDAAHCVRADYRGRALGGIGDLGAFSFHESKNYTSGQGGALCVNRDDLDERAEILLDRGTDRQKFYRGEVDKYTWVDVGSAFSPSEITCAFLYAQLMELDNLHDRREAIWLRYREQLQPLEDEGLLTLPTTHPDCKTSYHLFQILLVDEETRDALMLHMREEGIQCVIHYVPLHLSPMGSRLGYREGQLPATEDVATRLLRLPLYYELSEEDQDEVCRAVTRFLRGR